MAVLDVRWMAEQASLGSQRPFGARLTRLTSAPMISDDIYGEQPRTTPDGSRIAFRRQVPGHPSELWIADFGRARIGRVEGVSDNAPTAKYTGRLYCLRSSGQGTELIRLDLRTLEVTSLCDFTDVPSLASPCVSFDERWYFGLRSRGPHQYDIIRVALGSGKWTSIYQDPDICNPHLQTCPHSGDLLVQHNRGCEFDDSGQILRLVGDQGATLFAIDPDGGNYRQIPVGQPYSTWAATGHECWVGTTGWVAYTESRPPDAAAETGNFMAARPGDAEPTPLAPGYRFNHISVSACGRYFVGDASNLEGVPLVVGSVATGRSAIVCFSETTPGSPQWIHTHPYITPDNASLIFNSDRSGVPQVYRLELPDGLLTGLDGEAGTGLRGAGRPSGSGLT